MVSENFARTIEIGGIANVHILVLEILNLVYACVVCFQSIYEPGKRHWLKIKKDYLADGTMADTADLVVLGAYFGTGSKGQY